MDKQMLRTTITQLRQIALFAVGVSLLTACGNNQSGMKLGDNEFAVLAVMRPVAMGKSIFCPTL